MNGAAFNRLVNLAAGWAGSLNGWRLYGVMFFSGALSVFSFAPLHIVIFLVPSFSLLTLLITRAQSPRAAFIIGWWWGGGFFAAGLYWVSMALLVDAARFAWLIPIAIGLFALGLGLFIAVGTAITNKLAGGKIVSGALVLAGMWLVLEWLRSWLFTGFPWNLLGSAWVFSESTLQVAAYIGTYGLGALTVLAASAPAALADGRKAFASLLILIPASMALLGELRLMDASDDVYDGVRLRLVQPNIPQVDKWNPALRESHMFTQLEMGVAPTKEGGANPTHIIWGETQAPFFVADSKYWLNVISSMTPAGGLTILGAPRRISEKDESLVVANSMLAIDPAINSVSNFYDKFHLVPFGEYVPFADILPIEKITSGLGAFKPGPGLQTINLKGLPPVSPVICYEIIFPLAVASADKKPEWLLNLTNDAWYGKTQGPHQHFALSIMRSVEEGMALVRVANTGISGVSDGYGRIKAKSPLGVRAVVDADLPKKIEGGTIYSHFGNGLALGLALLLILAGVAMRKMQI